MPEHMTGDCAIHWKSSLKFLSFDVDAGDYQHADDKKQTAPERLEWFFDLVRFFLFGQRIVDRTVHLARLRKDDV